jgi:membrane protease YdiL (CAAX protease family)
MPAHILELTLLSGLATAAIIAGLACLIALFRRNPTLVLPPQRCRAVTWGAGLCLSVFILFSVPQQMIAGVIAPDHPAQCERVMAILIASLYCFPVQVVAFKATLRYLSGTILPLGLDSWKAVWRDARTGCATWLVATPAVLAIQFVVRFIAQRAVDGPPSENALIETLRDYGVNPSLWGLIAYEAVLLAPVREEFLFRGCIQSWLTRRPWGGDLAVALALITPAVLFGSGMSLAKIMTCAVFVAVTAAVFWMCESRLRTWSVRWPWLFPRLASGGVSAQASFRAVVGTSLLFAAFHAPSWPDPVPLFAFGLVLGWLGWRTQGVVAPMVCHATFNATSLMILRMSS